jgi:hypothetical protein
LPSRIRSSVTVHRAEAAPAAAGREEALAVAVGAGRGGPEVALGAGSVADGCPVVDMAGDVPPEVADAGEVPPPVPQPAAASARRVTAAAVRPAGRRRRAVIVRGFDEERIPFGYSSAAPFEPPAHGLLPIPHIRRA